MKLNIFSKPLNNEIVEGWAKILDNITKVAIIAIPSVIYGSGAIWEKVVNCGLLLLSIYLFLFTSKNVRLNKISEKENKPCG